MAKEVYYFSHDSNARHDPKCSALIAEFGAEAYGIFWMMIEILSEQENYKLKKFNKLYEGIGRQLWIDPTRLRTIIEAMLHEYELLVQDDEFIWSDSLLRRMDIKEEKRQKKIEAGRKGGKNSGESRKNKAESKQNEAPLQKNEANEAKESKVNEIILKESSTTTDDFKKVCIAYREIHKVLDMPMQDSPMLSKLLSDGISADLIISVMTEKVKTGVKTIKYYVEAIRERQEGKTRYVSPIEQEAINAQRRAEEIKNQTPLTYNSEFSEVDHAVVGGT